MSAFASNLAATRRSACAGLLVLLLAGTGASAADGESVKAADVMAAYLRYIAELTTWPNQTPGSSNAPIRIGVIGADPNGVMNLFRTRSRSGDPVKALGRTIHLLDLDSTDDDDLGLLHYVRRIDARPQLWCDAYLDESSHVGQVQAD